MFNLYTLGLLPCRSVFRGAKYTFCTLECSRCKNGIKKSDIFDFFCKECSWPVESTALSKFSPYELFKLDLRYDVDKGHISQLYKRYQFLLHPDRHGAKTREELEMISSNSSIVSTYYKMILDDKERAKRLFCIKYGEELFQQEINKTDPDQLEYIIKVHEEIDGLEDEGRAAMEKEFREKISDTVEKLNAAFLENDPHAVLACYKTLSFYRQVHDGLTR